LQERGSVGACSAGAQPFLYGILGAFFWITSMMPYLARSNQATCGSKTGGGLPFAEPSFFVPTHLRLIPAGLMGLMGLSLFAEYYTNEHVALLR
jgi:hypothetical protein